MTTRCAAAAVALAPLLIGSGAFAGDLTHQRASMLRAQQESQPEPAWLVERGDNSSLRLGLLMQNRYTASSRESGRIGSRQSDTYGFSQPRTQLSLDGSIVSSQLNYRVSFDFGDAELSRGRGNGAALAGNTGTPLLLDAFAQYNFGGKQEGYYLKFGQFQSIVMSEQGIDASRQLAIDHSLTSEIFGPGYTQGIALGRVLTDYAWEVSVNDGGHFVLGAEPQNTAFNSPSEADLGVSGRFDWKLKGSWDQFSDFTSFPGSTEGSKLGAGFMYQFTGQSNPGSLSLPIFPGPIESGQYVTWSVDFQHENDGWNFFAAYTGAWVDFEFDPSSGLTTLSSLHNAVVLQGGWFISEDIEWYARFETFWIDKDFRNAFGLEEGYIHRIATLGVTRYLIPESHAAKISADVSYAFDSLTVISVGASSIGLPDPSATGFQGLSDSELVVRLQLQLVF